MRTGWSNLMVIVVQGVGAGLMIAAEAHIFIKSHSTDDHNGLRSSLMPSALQDLSSYTFFGGFFQKRIFLIE